MAQDKETTEGAKTAPKKVIQPNKVDITKKASAKKTKQAEEGLTPIIGGKKTFDLSDGRKCVIREGTGADAEEATAVTGGNRKMYMSALMSQCITIDGKGIVAEDLPLLPLKDYLKIQGEFSDLNF